MLDTSQPILHEQASLTDLSYTDSHINSLPPDAKNPSTSKDTLPGIMSFLLMCIQNNVSYNVRIPESLVYLPSDKTLYLVYSDAAGNIINDSGPSVLYKFFDILEGKTDRKVQFYHVAKGYSRNFNHKAIAIDSWKSFENKGEVHAILKNFNISRVSYWIRSVWHADGPVQQFKIMQRKKSILKKHSQANGLFKLSTTDLNYAGRLQRTSFFPSLPLKSSLTFCKNIPKAPARSSSVNKVKNKKFKKSKKLSNSKAELFLPIETDLHLVFPTRNNSPTHRNKSLYIQHITRVMKGSEIEIMTYELAKLITSFITQGIKGFRASFIKDEMDRWCLFSVKSAEFNAESIMAVLAENKFERQDEVGVVSKSNFLDLNLRPEFKQRRASYYEEILHKSRQSGILKLGSKSVCFHKILDLRDSIEKSKQLYVTNFSKSPHKLPSFQDLKHNSSFSPEINNIISKFDQTMTHAKECLEHFTIAQHLKSYSLNSDTDILLKLSRDHFTYALEHPKLSKYFKSRCVSFERIVAHSFIRAFKQPITDKFKENLVHIHKGLKIKYTDFDLFLKIFIGVMKKYHILKSDRDRMCARLIEYSKFIIMIYDNPSDINT
jgi:hypothetical protein